MIDKKIQEEAQRLDKDDARSLVEHLNNPIYDDEPISAEEESAVAEALEDIKARRVYDFEELKKEFGL